VRRIRATAGRAGAILRAGLLPLVAAAVLLAAGCSPENGRARGELGADVGNTALPVELRGNVDRNNPSFRTPEVGLAPADAKGVVGWWAGDAR
jgi:hypothetical protein